MKCKYFEIDEDVFVPTDFSLIKSCVGEYISFFIKDGQVCSKQSCEDVDHAVFSIPEERMYDHYIAMECGVSKSENTMYQIIMKAEKTVSSPRTWGQIKKQSELESFSEEELNEFHVQAHDIFRVLWNGGEVEGWAPKSTLDWHVNIVNVFAANGWKHIPLEPHELDVLSEMVEDGSDPEQS